MRKTIPIYLGAGGPKNVAMATEIADGWMPVFFSVVTALLVGGPPAMLRTIAELIFA